METENDSLESVATRIEVEGPEIVADAVKTFIASKIDALVARTSDDDSPQRPSERIATWDLQKRVTTGLDVILSGGDPEGCLRPLERAQSPPTVCGKSIRAGDPVYQCRDCGADATCVLCSTCFQQSSHRTHRYKFQASSGSGFCDCGDAEAWKRDPWCDEHKPKEDESKEFGIPLDSSLEQRARALFEVCMRYAVHVLTWTEDGIGLPFGLKTRATDDCHMAFLCNDEVHSFEDVKRQLCRVIKCSKSAAMDIAMEVDRMGRCAIFMDCQKVCESVKEGMTKGTQKRGKILEVQVLHMTRVAHQMCALEILRWMKTLGNRYAPLRYLMCAVALQSPLDPHSESGCETILDSLLTSDKQLWKEARETCHNVFVNSMLMDPQCKKLFAKSFIGLYEKLQDDFLRGDHEHEVSICSFSVQLFTVPSLAQMLIYEHNALKVILDTYCKYVKTEIIDGGKRIVFPELTMPFLERGHGMLCDATYLLRHGRAKTCALESHKAILVDAFKSLLNLLSKLHGADASVRQTQTHVLYELDWRSAVQLQIIIRQFLPDFISWCAQEKTVFKECVELTVQAVRAHRTDDKYDDNGIVVYDVAANPSTIHYPLSRLLASLLLHCVDHGMNLDEALNTKENPRIGQCIVEEPLRAIVFVAQVNAGYWCRNGQAVKNQAVWYQHASCKLEVYDKDVILLQACAAIMDLDVFVQTMISRFGLKDWLGFIYGVDKLRTVTEEKFALDKQMVEEILRLLIIISSERFVPGVGKVTLEAAATRAVIHRLCLGPCTHSELAKVLPTNIATDSQASMNFDSILQQVATFTQTALSKPRLYELKMDQLPHFSPFYYRYSRLEQTQANKYLTERIRKEKSDFFLGLPGSLPEFAAPFRQTRDLLRCGQVIHLVNTTFGRTACLLSSAWSDAQSYAAMYLVALCLWDEEEHGKTGEDGRGRPVSELGLEDFTGCDKDKKLFTLDSIMKRLRNNQRIEEYSVILDVIFEKFLEMNEQDPKNAPTPEDAQIDFLRNMTAAPCVEVSGDAERLLKEAEERKARNAAAATAAAEKSKKPRSIPWCARLRSKWCKEKEAKKSKEEAKAKAKEAIQKRKQQMMENIRRQQERFIQRNESQLKPDDLGLSSSSSSSSSTSSESDSDTLPVAVGSKQTLSLRVKTKEVAMCLLCQEEQEISGEQPFVLAASIQKSAVFCSPNEKTTTKDNSSPLDLLKISSTGVHISSCGHAMHYNCWQRFVEMKQTERQRRRVALFMFDVCQLDSNEFFCPLCGSFSNAVLPMLPQPDPVCDDEGEDEGEDDDSSATCCSDVMQKVAKRCCCLQRESKGKDDSFLRFPRNMFCREAKTLVAKLANETDSCHSVQKRLHKSAFTVFVDQPPDEPERDFRLPVCVWSSCAYTIASFVATRGDCLPASPLSALSAHQAECLKSLVRHVNCMARVCCPCVLREHCLSLLLAIYCPNDPMSKVTLLELNSLAVLIGLLCSMLALDDGVVKRLVVTKGCQEEITRLSFAVCLVQAGLSFKRTESVFGEDDESETDFALRDAFRRLGLSADLEKAVPGFCQKIESDVKPFLTAASLFYHCLTGIPFAEESAGFFSLCHYLALPASWPSIIRFLDPSSDGGVGRLAQDWCRALEPSKVAKPFCQLRTLIDLPREYFSLIDRAASFRCPKSQGEGIRSPALCLVCGTFLCSQAYCCQTEIENETCGACTVHCRGCSGEVGVFLMIRECQVILLAGRGHGCFYSPPYFDEYGEVDAGLRRGNPLYLCEKSYSKLKDLWTNHEIYKTVMAYIDKHPAQTAIRWRLL